MEDVSTSAITSPHQAALDSGSTRNYTFTHFHNLNPRNYIFGNEPMNLTSLPESNQLSHDNIVFRSEYMDESTFPAQNWNDARICNSGISQLVLRSLHLNRTRYKDCHPIGTRQLIAKQDISQNTWTTTFWGNR